MNPLNLVPAFVYRLLFFVVIPVIAAVLWFYDPDAILDCASAEDFSDVRECAENIEVEDATREAVDKVRRLEELGE